MIQDEGLWKHSLLFLSAINTTPIMKGVFTMKTFIKTIFSGAAVGFGYLMGAAAFRKLSDPVVRKSIKKKFVNVKNAIFTKEES